MQNNTNKRRKDVHIGITNTHGRVGKRTHKYQMIPRTKAIIPAAPKNKKRGIIPAIHTRSNVIRQLNMIAHTGKHNNVMGKNNIETTKQTIMIIVIKQKPGHAVMRPMKRRLRTNWITPAIKPIIALII